MTFYKCLVSLQKLITIATPFVKFFDKKGKFIITERVFVMFVHFVQLLLASGC